MLSSPTSGLAGTPTGPPDPRCTDALAGNGRVAGHWAYGCRSAARPGRNARYYTFAVAEERQVELVLTSGVDAYLYLREGDAVTGAAPRWSDDDGAGDRNSRIEATLQPGSYIVEATTYYAGRSGSFELETAGLAHDAPAAPEAAPDGPDGDGCDERLAGDGSVSGDWTGDCASTARPDSHARYYAFRLDAASAVTIDLESDVDTYLYLREGERRDGPVRHEDDDGGSGYNSRISETLAAGEWLIEATTYDDRQTGSFTLGVGGIGSAGDAGEPGGGPDGGGSGGDGGTDGDAGLAAPVATATPGLGITLSWSAVDGATGYEYQYVYADRPWDSEWVRQVSVGADTLSVELRDEIGASRYNLRVRAVKEDGDGRQESGWSATVSAEPL